MTKGLRAYFGKEKKQMRLRNHIAKDLGSPKYRQRIKEPKKAKLIEEIRINELEEELHSGEEDYQEVYEVDGGDQRE